MPAKKASRSERQDKSEARSSSSGNVSSVAVGSDSSSCGAWFAGSTAAHTLALTQTEETLTTVVREWGPGDPSGSGPLVKETVQVRRRSSHQAAEGSSKNVSQQAVTAHKRLTGSVSTAARHENSQEAYSESQTLTRENQSRGAGATFRLLRCIGLAALILAAIGAAVKIKRRKTTVR